MTLHYIIYRAFRSAADRLVRLHRNTSGATATEYVLILALIVIPLAMLVPMSLRMIKTYSGRMSLMQLPFP